MKKAQDIQSLSPLNLTEKSTGYKPCGFIRGEKKCFPYLISPSIHLWGNNSLIRSFAHSLILNSP